MHTTSTRKTPIGAPYRRFSRTGRRAQAQSHGPCEESNWAGDCRLPLARGVAMLLACFGLGMPLPAPGGGSPRASAPAARMFLCTVLAQLLRTVLRRFLCTILPQFLWPGEIPR